MNFPVIAYFGTPGPVELTIIALVILLLFGKRLPGVMRSLGQSIVEFKKGTKEGEEAVDPSGEAASESEPIRPSRSGQTDRPAD